MNTWTWIFLAVAGASVGFLLAAPGQKANRRFEQWRIGRKSMLEDYDKETKEIDKFSR